MDNGDLDGSGEDEIHMQRGCKYRPVLDNDRVVLEMSSMDPGSSSYSNKPSPLKYVCLFLLLHISVHGFNVFC